MSHCDPNIPSGLGERFTPAFLPSGQKNSFQNLFLNLSILNFYRITSFFVIPLKSVHVKFEEALGYTIWLHLPTKHVSLSKLTW